MIDSMNKNLLLIKETGMLKASYSFDILDPQSGEVILECREEPVSRTTKFFRFTDVKRVTPFDLKLNNMKGEQALRISRKVPLFASKVKVMDESDHLIGGFNEKRFSIGTTFDVVDATGQPVCQLKGDFRGKYFHFMTPDGLELARTTKKWAGLGKELLTSADDYILEIDDAVPENSTIRQLIIASVLCIGLIVKYNVP